MVGALTVVALAAVQLAAATPSAAALPDVEFVLTKATDKARDFAEQASAMQRRVAQQQEKSRAALDSQRATYESKLSQQAAQSDASSANNSAIDKANKALQTSNSDLEAEVKTLQDDNAKMRQSLQAIDSKVAAAKLFLEDSLKVTDDTTAVELLVLVPTTPKPTLDHFLAVAGGATFGDALALLQLSSPLRHDGPEDLVSVLSKSLADIATAEVEGAAELKAHFMANFEEGQKRQAALNATQVTLLELQSELKVHQGKLLEAKAHLEATGKQLRDRLHGLRVFARKVDIAAVTTLGTPAPEAKPAQNLSAVAKESAKHVPVPKFVKRAGPPPAPLAAASVAAAAPASTPLEKPKAMLAEVRADVRKPTLRKQSNATVAKPAERKTSPQKKASAAVPESSLRKGSQKASGVKKESQHHKKRPAPPALIQSASVNPKVEQPFFMGTFFSALR